MNRGLWRSLQAASACVLLAGCGWFSDPAPTGKARPGADRMIAPTGTLPSASPGRGGEQGVAPTDETRSGTPPVGSVVKGSGGQRAQKEAADKAAAERDAKAREQLKATEPPATPAVPAAAPDAPKS